MRIEVTEGLNILSLGISDSGSYFRFIQPTLLVWCTDQSYGEKYSCQLPLDTDRKHALYNCILDEVSADFTEKVEELYEILKPLFKLFPNGEYDLNFNNGTRTYIDYEVDDNDETSAEDPCYSYSNSWNIQYSQPVNIENNNELISEYKTDINKNNLEKFHHRTKRDTNWLNHIEENIYFATQPLSNLNAERVLFYEEKISKGYRPFAILLYGYHPDIVSTEHFILDGHHKLQAYKNLNIEPAFIVIRRFFKSVDELEFDIEKLSELLQPMQIRNFLDNWQEKEKYITEILKRKDGPIRQFIRNGPYQEYHYNGNLKREGFYVHDYAEGLIREWYANGQQKHEGYFTNRIKTGIWKESYENGTIKSISSYDDHGKQHGEFISYLTNGNIRSKQHYKDGEPYGYEYRNSISTGNLEFECWYEDGVMFGSKQYTYSGQLFAITRHAPSRQYIPMPPPEIKSHATSHSSHTSYPYSDNELLNMLAKIARFALILLRFLK